MTTLRNLQANGHSFRVYDAGTGPAVLFVHGFPLDHTQWSAQLSYFSQTVRVIAPDLRGFGANPATDGTLRMQDLASDLGAILDTLGVDTPIVFCGLSMGGYVAWQFWNAQPERLRALILCDTRAAADSEQVARGRLQLAERVLREGAQNTGRDMLQKLLAPAHQGSPAADELLKVMTSTAPTTLAAALRGMAERPDMTERLGEIKLPTLVICGTDDVITPRAEMRAMADALPQAEWLEVPQAGHLSPLENPAVVNPAIERFLQSLDR